jgi:sterol desaturase/sphingolipid hydroxylase (fatty acid hydroxylase superfamily)
MFHIAGGIILAVIFFSVWDALFGYHPPPLTQEELDDLDRNHYT